MLNVARLRQCCSRRNLGADGLAQHLVQAGRDRKAAAAAVRNWLKGLLKPRPGKRDIHQLAAALSLNENDLQAWQSTCRYAPISSRKARLVTGLIAGRPVDEALDVLKFTEKRAASLVVGVLKSAIADADEQKADVESLYVTEARVDDAGIRLGTKRWRPKDRGRAHPIRKKACHIHVTVAQVKV